MDASMDNTPPAVTPTPPPGPARAASVLDAIRRRWRVAVACAVIVPVLVGLYSVLQPKEYTATSVLLFRSTDFAQQLFGSTVMSGSKDPSREAATNANLVSLRAVSALTAKELGDKTTAEVADAVTAAPEGTSDLVKISATDKRPAEASRIATTFADQFVQFRRQADEAVIDRANQLVTRQLASMSPKEKATPQGESLQRRSDQLRILASLQTGNAEVVQRAGIPTHPSSPRVLRNVVIALFLGMVLGVGLALLVDRLDQGIRSVDEIEKLIPAAVLARVPRRDGLRSAGVGATASPLHPSASDLDAFRLLRSHLRYFNVDREVKTLLVTSADAGAGKTTVSLCLAAALVQGGDRVVLVEADLRRPALRDRAGVAGTQPGLAEVLTGGTTLAEALIELPLEVAEGDADTDVQVTMLGSGAMPPNPAELLESRRMLEVLDELRADYDIVIVDSAPPLIVPDAVPLLRAVDGVIVVCRVGATRRTEAQRLSDLMATLGAPVLGTVANDIKSSGQFGRDYGYYGYGYAATTSGSA
jgi:capsular exopolysaccharide synthesis family protein